MTRDEAKQFFKDHNVRYVLAQFVDIHGAAKAKDFEAATGAWKTMLDSCNACHKQFENGKHILQP